MNDFIKKHFQPDRSALVPEFRGLLGSQMDACGPLNRIFQTFEGAVTEQQVCVAPRRYWGCLNERFKSFYALSFQLFWRVSTEAAKTINVDAAGNL